MSLQQQQANAGKASGLQLAPNVAVSKGVVVSGDSVIIPSLQSTMANVMGMNSAAPPGGK